MFRAGVREDSEWIGNLLRKRSAQQRVQVQLQTAPTDLLLTNSYGNRQRSDFY